MTTSPSLFREVRRTARLVYAQDTAKDRVQRLKYIIRCLIFASQTREWFEFLENPKFGRLLQRHPRVYSKLQRPYLNHTFTSRQKLELLKSHYRFVAENFSDEMISSICTGSGWKIGGVNLEGVGEFKLFLRTGCFEKEGDFTLTLVDEQRKEAINSITFTVTHWNSERRELLIGGLQGHHFADEKARTIEITRGMFGLRPKAMMVFAVQQFATLWNITCIRAISNDMHIYRSLQKRRTVHADYDSFWIECGGEKDAQGSFILPIVPPLKNIAELKPNKRTVYRKRYAMLAKLADEINGRPTATTGVLSTAETSA